MKRSVMVLSLVVLLGFLVGGPPAGAIDDPCGGHYVGKGLRAMFLPAYGASTCNDGQCAILNDAEGVYYQYGPGGDCVYLFKAGHVIVGIGNSGRSVKMDFIPVSLGTECPPLPSATCITESFMMGTSSGFSPSRGYQGDSNVLVLTNVPGRLNFAAMTPGKTYYCQISFKYRFAGDPAEYQDHFQAKVFYGYEEGVLRWVITPIDEPYWVYIVTKVGKKYVPIEPPTWHAPSVYGQISSDICGDHGTYCRPFKLILEQIN